MPPFRSRAAVAVALLVALAGCASPPATGASIAIESSDTACTLSATSAPAGPTTFSVRNAGGETTELYIYRPDGTVVSELEDITPGVSRDMTVDLEAGAYEVACKPGEREPGFREAFTVVAASS
jgi:iron uptake system component EfeO